MERMFRIYRYDPEKDSEPHYVEYTLEVAMNERILDCLNEIRWLHDPTLSYRMSCSHGVCGSDGMKINGICAIACQKLIKDYGEGTITIEPLPNFRVIRDLVVDLTPFFDKYRMIKPYLFTEDAPDLERLQSPEERNAFDEAIRCILCGNCTAACPITEKMEGFLGPAALLRSFRYLFDSRDRGTAERMEMLDNNEGIWGCKTHGKCTEVCPKEIGVSKALGRIKKKLYDSKRGVK
jgi:succinate dehydrogenase / fumarate reductase, iron-sulfur subunit